MQSSYLPIQLRYLVTAYIVLGILYLFSAPVLEAPDEIYHVAMINYVANTGELPVQRLGIDTDYKQEGSQPPLYYLITGFLTRWIDRTDYDQLRLFNPHANTGQAELMGNKNRIVHEPTSAQNMVYVARFFSLICGAITVFAVYQSARLFAPTIKHLPLFATGLVVFNPQFLFISTAANNDVLVIMFNTLSLWLTLKTLRDGFDTRRSLILSIFIALGTISKLSGLVMVMVAALTGLYVGIKRRDLRGLVTLAVLMAGIWGILGAWWYIRNLTLYDELFGTGMMLTIFGGRSPLTPDEWLRTMLNEFGGLRWSYWAVFGWFNIITWKWIYAVIDMVSLVALVGFIPFVWKNRHDNPLRENIAIAGLMLTIGTLSFLSWTTQTTGSQGRLLFPFIAPASIFLALGLMQFKIRPLWVLAPLVIFAVSQPIFIIRPNYDTPPVIDALPSDAVGVGVVFDHIEFVGYQLTPSRWDAGDEIPITVYWRPLAQSDRDYSLAITAILPDLSPIASVNSYPGWGSLRTTTWQTGVIYADSYVLQFPETISASGDIRLLVSWWKYPEGDYLLITDDNGRASRDILLFAGGINTTVSPPELPNMTPAENIIFGDMFRLVGHTWADNTLSLLWEVVSVPDNAYTVFAFALADSDAGRVVIGQGDNTPPMSTQFYRVGEQFLTAHTIIPADDADAGTYPLYIGWYRENTRLSVDAPDNMYAVDSLIIP